VSESGGLIVVGFARAGRAPAAHRVDYSRTRGLTPDRGIEEIRWDRRGLEIGSVVDAETAGDAGIAVRVNGV